MRKISIFNYEFKELCKNLESERLCSVEFFSYFLQNEFLRKIKSNPGCSYELIDGLEITSEWIDSKVSQQTLFFEEKNYLVRDGDNLSEDLIQKLQCQEEIRCIFIVEKRKTKGSLTDVGHYHILGPKFWEYQGS